MYIPISYNQDCRSPTTARMVVCGKNINVQNILIQGCIHVQCIIAKVLPIRYNAIRNTSIIRQTFMLKVRVRIPHVIFDPVLTCPLTITNALPSVEGIPSSTAQSAPSYEPLTVSVPSTNLTTTEPPSYKDKDAIQM